MRLRKLPTHFVTPIPPPSPGSLGPQVGSQSSLPATSAALSLALTLQALRPAGYPRTTEAHTKMPFSPSTSILSEVSTAAINHCRLRGKAHGPSARTPASRLHSRSLQQQGGFFMPSKPIERPGSVLKVHVPDIGCTKGWDELSLALLGWLLGRDGGWVLPLGVDRCDPLR